MNGLSVASVRAFVADQVRTVETARVHYGALKDIRTRWIEVNGYGVWLQFNPARIRSSAAKVDVQSLRERKCFLCKENLLDGQRSIPFGRTYEIMLNPYPIFSQHLTIPLLRHEDQRIGGRYGDMLLLSEALTEFVVFYNGPQCGASAPDHMHFQAGVRDYLPIEKQWTETPKEVVFSSGTTTMYALRKYTHPLLVLVSENRQDAVCLFDQLYRLLPLKEGNSEPMMNILCWYESGKWVTCICPREKLRPSCYDAEGDTKILLSPASVEMGGLFVVPLENDYLRLTATDLQQVLSEVCIGADAMDVLIRICKKELTLS